MFKLRDVEEAAYFELTLSGGRGTGWFVRGARCTMSQGNWVKDSTRRSIRIGGWHVGWTWRADEAGAFRDQCG